MVYNLNQILSFNNLKLIETTIKDSLDAKTLKTTIEEKIF